MDIKLPTISSRVRVLSDLHKKAANGAANKPPNTRPATIGQGPSPTNKEKAMALEKVKKNSAKFTVPMVTLGS